MSQSNGYTFSMTDQPPPKSELKSILVKIISGNLVSLKVIGDILGCQEFTCPMFNSDQDPFPRASPAIRNQGRGALPPSESSCFLIAGEMMDFSLADSPVDVRSGYQAF